MFLVVTTEMTKQLVIRYYNIMIIVMKTTNMFFAIFKNMISVTITVAMTIVMLIADHGNENLSVTINKRLSIMSMLKRHITHNNLSLVKGNLDEKLLSEGQVTINKSTNSSMQKTIANLLLQQGSVTVSLCNSIVRGFIQFVKPYVLQVLCLWSAQNAV